MKMQCYISVAEHYFPASSVSKCLWVLVKQVSVSLMRQSVFGDQNVGNSNIDLVLQAKKADSVTALRNLLLTSEMEQDRTGENLQRDNQTQPCFVEHGWSNGACLCLCYTWQYKGRTFLTRQDRDMFQTPFISPTKLLRTWATEMLDSKLSVYKALDSA